MRNLVIMGCVLCVVAQCSATISYSQNFENVALGGDPKSDPVNRVFARLNAAEGDDKWNQQGVGGSDYSPSIVDAAGGTRSLEMGYGYGSSQGLGNCLQRAFAGGIQSGEVHNFSFDFKATAGANAAETLEIKLEPTGWRYGVVIILGVSNGNVLFQTDSTIKGHGTVYDLRATLTSNTWYHVAIGDIDSANMVYDLSLRRVSNNELITSVQDIAFNTLASTSAGVTLNELNLFKWGRTSNLNPVDLDNINIAPVPEPATLVLLGAGLFLFRKRS